MAQISLYIDDSTSVRLKEAAQNSNCSVSKYVAALISSHLDKEYPDEKCKKKLLKQLRGALNDPDFTK